MTRRPRRHGVLALLIGLGLSAGLGSALAAPKPPRPAAPTAQPAAPAGVAQRGKDKAESERCIECHAVASDAAGHDARIEVPPPALQGQQAAYLVKQVRDFRSGARRHDFMAIMARSIDDADAADIAAYYAALPPPHGPRPGVSAGLYAQGDAGRGIPACAGCHGERGEGGERGPRLAGQPSRYLQAQLRAWRSGERTNSPDGAMGQAARALSDAEIDALSTQLSAP
jgi:cytochrome c553